MAIEESFIAKSAKMVGTPAERRYEYEVIKIDKETGESIGESEKDTIERTDLQEADRIFFRVTGGHLKGDEVAYRWVAGPFPTIRGLEEAIEDMMIYDSP